MNLLDLMVKISAQDEATPKVNEISNNIVGKMGAAAKLIGGAMIAGTTAAAGAVGAIGAAAFQAYSNYEQLSGGVQKLFGDSANIIAQNAANAYKTSGMSANQYMQQATTFSAALINSLGGDTKRAAEQSEVAMRAMSDNINTFGSNAEDVQNAFNGFAKQNFTMLDNLKLGYAGTKEGMQQLIADANEYGKATGQASDLTVDSFSDIVTAIELVQQKQGIAGTTAKEAASTMEGSINMAKAAWENFVAGLGNPDADLTALTTNLTEALGNVATNAIPIVQRIGEGIVAAFPMLAEKVSQALPSVLQTAADAIVTGVPAILQGAASAVSAAWPVIAGIVQQEVGKIVAWVQANTGIDLSGMVGGFQTAFDKILATAQTVTGALQTFAQSDFGQATIQVLSDAVGTLASNIDLIIPILSSAAAGFTAFKTATAISGVIDGVRNAFVALKTAEEGVTVAQQILNLVVGENPFVFIATVIAVLVTAFITLMATNEDFRNAVLNAWNTIASTAQAVWGAIVNFFTVDIPNAFNNLVTTIQNIPAALASFATSFGQMALDAGAQFLANIGNFLMNLPMYILTGLFVVLLQLGIWAGQFGQWAITAGSQFLANIGGFLANLPSNIWNFLVSAISFVGNFAGQLGSWAINAGTTFLNNIGNFFRQLPSNIWNFLVSVISNIANFASQMGQKATSAARDFANNLINGITSLPGKMMDMGGQIINGLINGIKNFAGGVVDAVTGAVGGAINAAKNLLGIHSPSRVFRQIGDYTMQGLEQGILGGADSVTGAMSSVIDDITQAGSTALDGQNIAGSLSAEFAASNASSMALLISWIDANLGKIIEESAPVATPREWARLNG